MITAEEALKRSIKNYEEIQKENTIIHEKEVEIEKERSIALANSWLESFPTWLEIAVADGETSMVKGFFLTQSNNIFIGAFNIVRDTLKTLGYESSFGIQGSRFSMVISWKGSA
jgi:hypothetical protein